MKDAPKQMQQFATAEKAYRLTGAASANLIRQWAARGLIKTYRWHDSKVYRLSEIREVMQARMKMSETHLEIATCSRCHEEKPCTLAVDPFVGEGIIDGPEVLEHWCEECLDHRRGDV